MLPQSTKKTPSLLTGIFTTIYFACSMYMNLDAFLENQRRIITINQYSRLIKNSC